jgi:hypothetical protein
MSGTLFREVNLAEARMYGVLLTGADIDGAIWGLRVNGVEIAPLIEAELDRLHPERTKLRPTTPDGMREALAVVESFWAQTMKRAQTLAPADLHRSVNDEWSLTETLRHLIFVTDAWFGHAIQGEPRPFHPLGLPASFMTGSEAFGINAQARPELEDVMAARAERIAMVKSFLETVTQDDLDRVREPNTAPGWPPPEPRTATSCLHVIFSDEWEHHRFATRDLAIIEARR